MPFDDPEMEQLALKAIRRLKSEFVKQEVYADTSPCGLADAVYADAESNEICAMEREGPINKCLLDDILHITKDRAGSEPCLSGVGAPGQRDSRHALRAHASFFGRGGAPAAPRGGGTARRCHRCNVCGLKRTAKIDDIERVMRIASKGNASCGRRRRLQSEALVIHSACTQRPSRK